MNASRCTAAVAISLATIACAPSDHVDGVLRDMLEARDLGLPRSGLPPFYTGCGRVQPGYDPGDPTAEPPVPPTLDGSPYAIERDGFCTVSFTRRVSLGDDGFARVDEHIYLVSLGEPDPDVTLAPHLADLRDQLAAGSPAHYCHFRWRVDAEAYESYPESDVQMLTWTLEEVSHYCSREYVPMVSFVPGYSVREVAIRSTDPDVFLFLPENLSEANGGANFRGYFGVPDTGGAGALGQAGGVMTYYEACDVEPAAEGPGVCATRCRLFSPSADGSLPRCAWGDIGALPANPGLIDPAWIDEHRALYDEVHGGG